MAPCAGRIPTPCNKIVPSLAVNDDCLIITGRERFALPDGGGAGAIVKRDGAGAKRLVQSQDGRNIVSPVLLGRTAFLHIAPRHHDLPTMVSPGVSTGRSA